MFEEDISTAPFMREGTISPNWTYLVQHISQSGAPETIDLEETRFTPYNKEDPRKTPSHETRIIPENKNNTLMTSQSVFQIQESPGRKGAPVSEVIKLPDY